ncbi:uncharacterized protein CYBJADRAFT_167606 [Cyberlindnera jadinii NRRL Y-1542]|uniref:Peptidase A1 domain-containing protein n=1 Tax=Cyberlindnera jadinii (strain ATCC 18201 / CBS 1600 / BCRC 20928 / JCM 3617 / NBRC 0987 / NRRL Y-1542) TaxID=983966 RepID=A0A1E4S244_CYBJN|nr:hypothetical protein CYBJADRAFT_167606 [Cyberlindnera jadinii NRRL Y-1542]ODV73576.1 hypothetical protein CYBJADRAFT_167606 [Cyberlindnera jadinii NRRL Y-1542]
MALLLSLFLMAASVSAMLAHTKIVEYNFYRDTRVEQTVPLQGSVNEIIFDTGSYNTMQVTTSNGKKLYKIQRSGDRWHIQGPNKVLLATVVNEWFNKYVVMNQIQQDAISGSVSTTSPSVIKLDGGFLGFRDNRDQWHFCFGSNVELIWCGLNHFEVVSAPIGHFQVDDIHRRVAWVSKRVGDKYRILFNYESINMEILVSTFLLVFLTGGKRLLRPKIPPHEIV